MCRSLAATTTDSSAPTALPGSIDVYSVILCICLFITNWFRLALIHLVPLCHMASLVLSFNMCALQGFVLHVFSLFYVSLALFLRLFWHYSLFFTGSSHQLSVTRYVCIFFSLFFGLCLFTFPSFTGEWASITFDPILRLCIVDYTFTYSYTFFILVLAYAIPFLLMIVSHRMQMRMIDQHCSVTFPIKRQVRTLSISLLLWSLFTILLSILFHFPSDHVELRRTVFHLQMLSFLIEPIFCLFMFYSISKVSLFKSINGMYFIQ